MSSKYVCLVLVALTAYAAALTTEEKAAFREGVAPIIAECSKEYQISEGEISAAKEALNTDNLKPCFLGCFFKKLGAINDQGLFDPVAANEKSKQFITNEEDLKKIEGIANTCASVNDADVSDGNQGCDRAKLLVECFSKNKGDFSPF